MPGQTQRQKIRLPERLENIQRHLTSARTYRAFRASAMNMWRVAVAVASKYARRRFSRVLHSIT